MTTTAAPRALLAALPAAITISLCFSFVAQAQTHTPAQPEPTTAATPQVTLAPMPMRADWNDYRVGDTRVKTPGAANDVNRQVANERLEQLATDADTKPQLLKSRMPVMSVDALRMRRFGPVLAQLRVSPEGKVTEVEILQSPSEYLSRDVKLALAQWEFSPLVINGVPTAFAVRQSYNFQANRL